ncbi:MAG TPA: hypothetical protein VFX58_14970 [Chitinophagaceae bacterium]|nr:hypothetical protein [Chitinophagaceae bacterium]
MPQNNNILQELKELESTLHDKPSQNVYSVPGGYFENLAEQVLNRIRATEAGSVEIEISFLSPLVASIGRNMPYSIPTDYFEDLETRLSPVKQDQVYESSREELESISPLLSGLKKAMPYSIPADYFESLAPQPVIKPKVVSFSSRPWFRYAAAALVTGIIATTFFLLNRREKIDPSNNSYTWVEKKMKKVSTDEIQQFVQLADETLAQKEIVASVSKSNEVKEMIKDIPAREIEEFLNEISAAEPAADEQRASSLSEEESIMN